MMIVEQGKIVEFAAEAGEYTWNSSSEPTIFQGGLEGLEGSWETSSAASPSAGTLQGSAGVLLQPEGTGWQQVRHPCSHPLPCCGQQHRSGYGRFHPLQRWYSYKIADPMLFYKNVCGNVSQDYTRDQLDSQLKSEFLTALQPAFARISALGIRYSACLATPWSWRRL